MLRKIIPLLVLFLGTCAYGLTIEDIIKLSKADVGDEIILSVIAVSEDKIELKTDDIIRLKKEGVSSKVISALIQGKGTVAKAEKPAKKAEPKNEEPKKLEPKKVALDEEEQAEERSPFDQFFLSTYYSTQYGWPTKNYDNPTDILRQGLYYQAPDQYPDARYVRVYGTYHSYAHGPHIYSSPFSIIIPRRYSHRHYNKHHCNK